jgi:hypothetical protein
MSSSQETVVSQSEQKQPAQPAPEVVPQQAPEVDPQFAELDNISITAERDPNEVQSLQEEEAAGSTESNIAL